MSELKENKNKNRKKYDSEKKRVVVSSTYIHIYSSGKKVHENETQQKNKYKEMSQKDSIKRIYNFYDYKKQQFPLRGCCM